MRPNDDFDFNDTENEADREDGRNPGQGWWLEEQTRDAIQDMDDLDIFGIELNVTIASLEVDIAIKTQLDARWVIECKDWQAGTISPHDVFRIAAIANRANAYPMIVHIEDTEITDRAALLCKELCIPRHTLTDLQERNTLLRENYKRSERAVRLGLRTARDNRWSDLPDVLKFPDNYARKTNKVDEKAGYVTRKPGQ